MPKCVQCLFDYCDKCEGNCECTHGQPNEVEASTSNNEEINWRTGGAKSRRHKRDAAIRDPESTGRKRAAKLYPLEREKPCEWQNASPDNPKGGGSKPITVGCNKKQENRHHGPDKNTLNNEPGNVHRICSLHHNRWHAANDPEYVIGELKGD